jgi:hypothetical protein
MDKFICISYPKSLFDDDHVDYCDIVEIQDDRTGIIWVRGVEKEKAMTIAKALNDASNNPKG